jgi:hypothetical protein
VYKTYRLRVLRALRADFTVRFAADFFGSDLP